MTAGVPVLFWDLILATYYLELARRGKLLRDTKAVQPGLVVLPKQVAGDDRALHFAGAFVDGNDAGVAVHALDIGLTRITEAAMDLHGFVNDAINHFAGVEFCLRSGRAHPFA